MKMNKVILKIKDKILEKLKKEFKQLSFEIYKIYLFMFSFKSLIIQAKYVFNRYMMYLLNTYFAWIIVPYIRDKIKIK